MTADHQLEAAATLARSGIAVQPPWAPNEIVINERHPAIAKIFAGSEWEGRWQETLLKIPGSRRIDKPHLVGGVEGPGIALPIPIAMKIIEKMRSNGQLR